MRFWTVGVVLLALSAVAAPQPQPQPQVERVAAASIDAQWSEPGPWSVTVEALDAAHTVYRPADLGAPGTLHPVILWGNGTGVTPKLYDGLLRHWASHGFVVAAANTPNAGSGTEMLAGATRLISENDRPDSPYHQRIDTAHIGASGHSQGGGGAIAAGADPRVSTTVPIEPGPQGSIAALHGPLLLLGGQLDLVVPPPVLIIPRYAQADHVVAVYAELAGAGHATPAGSGGGFRGVSTAWFRFWLSDDEAAAGVFFGPGCAVCADRAWSDVRRNARAAAVPDPSSRS
ncbi:chlorophyllase/cutinase-like alpha/beta fold protein [Pseudonocardia sp. CA-107938]|uniref:poly(ethylene terephthalate) hydrolase family protein n=1 Tax=Pseudonocardia sp. CA-107938 TaxID=3240021 RepID=UPI003D945C8E